MAFIHPRLRRRRDPTGSNMEILMQRAASSGKALRIEYVNRCRVIIRSGR
jgi:hypothetical protein